MNGAANAIVGSAATEIAAHCHVDVGISGLRLAREQRRSGHDLSGLAIAALRHVFRDPSLLQRVTAICRKAFDGCDLFSPAIADGELARDYRFAVEMHRASAALAQAAAELRAGKVERIAQDPKQRRIRLDLKRALLLVDGECN